MGKRKAVFFDRDGVVIKAIERKGHSNPTAPFSMQELEFYPGVEGAMILLRNRGFLCVLVTNQPDVAKGNMSEGEWQKIQNEVITRFQWDGIYVCRHLREENCECKKPKPGMLLRAAKDLEIDLPGSYMIGDTVNDADAARAAGVGNVVIINTSYNRDVKCSFRAEDVFDAAFLIVFREDLVENLLKFQNRNGRR